MTINSKTPWRTVLMLIIGSFLFSHSLFLLSNTFGLINSQIVDRLLVMRSSLPRFSPPYDDTVVHIDLNRLSTEKLNSPYINRSQYASLIRNLGSMALSAQLYDTVFLMPVDEKMDQADDALSCRSGGEARDPEIGLLKCCLPAGEELPGE